MPPCQCESETDGTTTRARKSSLRLPIVAPNGRSAHPLPIRLWLRSLPGGGAKTSPGSARYSRRWRSMCARRRCADSCPLPTHRVARPALLGRLFGGLGSPALTAKMILRRDAVRHLVRPITRRSPHRCAWTAGGVSDGERDRAGHDPARSAPSGPLGLAHARSGQHASADAAALVRTGLFPDGPALTRPWTRAGIEAAAVRSESSTLDRVCRALWIGLKGEGDSQRRVFSGVSVCGRPHGRADPRPARGPGSEWVLPPPPLARGHATSKLLRHGERPSLDPPP